MLKGDKDTLDELTLLDDEELGGRTLGEALQRVGVQLTPVPFHLPPTELQFVSVLWLQTLLKQQAPKDGPGGWALGEGEPLQRANVQLTPVPFHLPPTALQLVSVLWLQILLKQHAPNGGTTTGLDEEELLLLFKMLLLLSDELLEQSIQSAPLEESVKIRL